MNMCECAEGPHSRKSTIPHALVLPTKHTTRVPSRMRGGFTAKTLPPPYAGQRRQPSRSLRSANLFLAPRCLSFGFPCTLTITPAFRHPPKPEAKERQRKHFSGSASGLAILVMRQQHNHRPHRTHPEQTQQIAHLSLECLSQARQLVLARNGPTIGKPTTLGHQNE